MAADNRPRAIIRYYVVSMQRGGETIRLGATSADEAKKAIRAMRRDGRTVDLIRRGTEAIHDSELEQEALREVSLRTSP